MAYATITVTNGVEIKKVPLGFSWTTFFFGGWPAIFRQDWIVGVVILILSMVTWGIAGVVFAFIYNNMYAKSLFSKGYSIHTLPPGITQEMVRDKLGYIKFPNEV
jgi:hypothetical protein